MSPRIAVGSLITLISISALHLLLIEDYLRYVPSNMSSIDKYLQKFVVSMDNPSFDVAPFAESELIKNHASIMPLLRSSGKDRNTIIRRHESTPRGNSSYQSGFPSSEYDQFSPWVLDYISFHQSSVVGGKLGDGAAYIIYECKGGSVKCGGSGDRLIGMIKLFYLAMCTRRVLLIDSTYPIAISAVLNPSYIEWNAAFPETTQYFSDMEYNVTLGLHEGVRGYRIKQTNAVPRKKGLDDIWTSELTWLHLKKNGWVDLAAKISFGAMAREAFHAMFKLTTAVVSRAEELKASAGIKGPYLGMHMRKGDINMGVANPQLIDRTTDNTKMLDCYHKMKTTHAGKFEVAYIASDDVTTKHSMASVDASILFPKDLRPFHVDIDPLMGNRVSNESSLEVYRGMVDTWAEMVVLAGSACMIVHNSMFSFGSAFMTGNQTCAVRLDKCGDPRQREGKYVYYAESIYGRGFVTRQDGVI